MSVTTYQILHILGLAAVFVALGAALRGGDGPPGRKLIGITHGVALLLILVSGFGMLAKLKYGFEGWVWAKIAIWILIGALPVLIRRLPQYATALWFAIPLLGAVAAYLALYKPF